MKGKTSANHKPVKPRKCKTDGCERDAKMGYRGMCGGHYQEYIKAKKERLKLKEQKAKKRQKKAESFSKLRDDLDRVFSQFIRLRDTDENGVGVCIDCGERAPWGEFDNGHFISRDRLATRWDEENCAAQKRSCNRFHSGRQFEFAKGLDMKYGAGTADALLEKSRVLTKFSTAELKEKIEYYKVKVAQLISEKKFEPWKK